MRGTPSKYLLPANSLVEVIVALIILLFVFSIVIEFLTRINPSSLNAKKIEASGVLNSFIKDTEKQKKYFTSKEQINNWLVSKEIQTEPRSDSLSQIRYTVSDIGDSLLTPLIIKYKIVNLK